MPDKNAFLKDVIKLLKKRYGADMHTFLEFSSPWQLLVATILSAQAQDAQVNKATKVLFKRYPDVEDYLTLRPTDLYKYVGSIGLYRAKSKNIIKSAKLLELNFNSKVPKSIEQLITLHGVGRKTANVVLSNAHHISQGIAIDTHCTRIANRLHLANTKDPIKIENALMAISPKEEWNNINHLFIALGRDACTARRKYCENCILNKICPSSDAK